MKKLIILSVIIIGGLIGATETSAHHRVSNYFYNGLHPHGTWIEIDHGVVVWRPTIMRRDWSPYREGRWIWTTDGWYWHSYEPFGYITYHYGRWYYDDYYGWLWVPGYEYAPAWVEWRYGDDYIGWAPLHPYTTIYITIGVVYPHSYYNPYYHWNFVTYNHFYDPYVYNYCVGPRYKYRVHSKTRYRTNYVRHNGRIRNNGVDIGVVRNRSGQRIRERDLLRVSDERTLNRTDRIEKDRIRTVYKSRDELERNEVRGKEIKRSRHKTSLDLSRVQIREVKERNKRNSNRDEQRKQLYKRTNEKRKFSGTSDRTKEPRKKVVREKNSREKSQDKNLYRRNNSSNEKRNIDKNSSFNRNDQRHKKKSVQQNVNRNRNNDKKVRTKTTNRNRNDSKTFVTRKNRNDNKTQNKSTNSNRRQEKSGSDNKRKVSRR
ncbi:MAG: hypothetical protein JSW63_05615 [Ignavibacterium sp.]|nr:MAG: hypothetical protein JSW63_05615 [Ignavibacterium sp.]